MLQPGGFLLNPLLKYGITFRQFCQVDFRSRVLANVISM